MADDRAVSPLASGRLPRLTHEQLRQAQREASASPRRRYGIAARVLFRQIGHDELVHKIEKDLMKEARFR
jgi:hypothetical protein